MKCVESLSHCQHLYFQHYQLGNFPTNTLTGLSNVELVR